MGMFDKLKEKAQDALKQAVAPTQPVPVQSVAKPAVSPSAKTETEIPRAQDTEPGLEDTDTPRVDSDGEDWGGWDPKDWAAYWDKVYAIELAGNTSDEALDEALHQYGLRDKAHFDRVREAFNNAYGHDSDFSQAGLDSRGRTMKATVAARMQGELKGELEPVEGASLQQWAWVMAKIASGGNVEELLKIAGWDRPKWDRVSAEWNARMSRDTTATVATAYGQAFVATGAGPFGEAGQQAAGSMTDASQRDVAGKEPISFERWIEIGEAQNAASSQGVDAASVLKSYGMTPGDWGTVSAWWSQKFNANAMKMHEEYTRLQAKYKAKFAAGFQADNISF